MQLLRASPNSRRWAVTTAFATITVIVALAACSHFGGTAPSPDITTAKVSAHRLYRASVRPDVVPIPVRRLQSWTLHIDTVDGRPLDVATITMNGGMPQHGHGLPTTPRVTRALGNGNHLVEGVKFNMGGWWVVRFAIASAAGTDTVTFNLSL
jgi:YtkA-like protein